LNSKKSGFSRFLSEIFKEILPNNEFLIINIMNIIGSLFSELVSNVSSVLILLPVLEILVTIEPLENIREMLRFQKLPNF